MIIVHYEHTVQFSLRNQKKWKLFDTQMGDKLKKERTDDGGEYCLTLGSDCVIT